MSIDYIQKVVCDYYNMPVNLLFSKSRKRDIVHVRYSSMYFAKNIPICPYHKSEQNAAIKTTLPSYTLADPLKISSLPIKDQRRFK